MKLNLKAILFTVISILIICGCTNEPKSNKDKVSVAMEPGMEELAGDVGEEGEGEEDGTQYSKSDIYDVVNKGVHLILKYNSEINYFMGTVENMTEETINKVRVEVHLSNGTELGPTTPVNVEPGKKIAVKLEATENAFETWSTHAEVGESEHSGEGEGEHQGEHK